MKAGQVVTYHDGDGGQERAVVLAVTGAGASHYKTLDLTLASGKVLTGIVHLKDREIGLGFWALADEHVPEEPTVWDANPWRNEL